MASYAAGEIIHIRTGEDISQLMDALDLSMAQI